MRATPSEVAVLVNDVSVAGHARGGPGTGRQLRLDVRRVVARGPGTVAVPGPRAASCCARMATSDVRLRRTKLSK